ncbi:MAG: hypothetical protein GY928_04930 [Colwellia sp.]|nr:hypothetical protein [Colwellia sp.]
MTVTNIVQTDFSAGELSPKVHGRFGLKLYQRGLGLCENFISEPQGPVRFRTGTRYVNHTRLNKVANLLSFQYNDEQSYMLEFTELKMRIFRDEGVVLEADVSITSTTNADPVVVTATAHGYSDGDEVYISGVATATDLNNDYYLVANSTANTFEITDVDGTDIAGTAAGTGGTCARIFELDTPYLESELFEFDHAQNADTVTITHNKHDIRDITRTNHNAWSISTETRTNDPFPSQTITGITQASPGVVTSIAHGFSDGVIVTLQGVVGMTEVNGNSYIVTNSAADTFELYDLTETAVDTSGYTAWAAGGTQTVGDYPAAVGYYEGRRLCGGTFTNPETFWGSMGPDSSTGASRYTNHSTGTAADDAFAFTIPPSFEGTVNSIKWIAGMESFLAIGTFGGINKVIGSGTDNPIAVDSVNQKPITDVGSASISPIPRGNVILYIQRGGLKIRSLEFDVLAESFTPVDRTFVSDHIGVGGFKHIIFQDGEPDVLWGVLNNGGLAGLTFKTSEDVSGWHRHILGGTDVNVIAVGAMTIPAGHDQVWVVVERTINSLTRRFVEFFEGEAQIPLRSDFITGDANEATDDVTFANAMFEAQKGYVHLDSTLSYDGSAVGSDASATLTPASAAIATGITFTASAAVFDATMVGRELWRKAIDGVGEGRAVITAYTDTTHVDCTITKAFTDATAMAAGNWYLTKQTFTNLEHLEGETVSIVTDGAEHPQETVSSGSITADFQASVAHIGLGYTGRLRTLNLESGAVTGPGQTKPAKVVKINPRFLNTARCRFGTDYYNLKELVFRKTSSFTNRPSPLFTGVPDTSIIFPSGWEKEKQIIIEQTHPLPCTVQSLDVYMEVSDE